MPRFFLVSLLIMSSLASALAQRLVTQTAALAAGQGVFLNLRFAHHIRVRPGAALTVQARVRINDNQLNEAFSLRLEPGASEVSVVEKLDEAALRAASYAGRCPDGEVMFGNRNGQDGATRGNCVMLDYEVTLPAGTALRISTISGQLDISGLRGAITAKTISGQVKLDWPASQSAELSLKTVTGEVYADPAVTFSNLQEHSYVGYELHGRYGSGTGPLVKLESVSGDVFFRKQP